MAYFSGALSSLISAIANRGGGRGGGGGAAALRRGDKTIGGMPTFDAWISSAPQSWQDLYDQGYDTLAGGGVGTLSDPKRRAHNELYSRYEDFLKTLMGQKWSPGEMVNATMGAMAGPAASAASAFFKKK